MRCGRYLLNLIELFPNEINYDSTIRINKSFIFAGAPKALKIFIHVEEKQALKGADG